MNSTPIVTGFRPRMSIGYKNNSWKVLGFIATEGDVSTDPGYTYSYFFLVIILMFLFYLLFFLAFLEGIPMPVLNIQYQ